jgi:PAS domain S-box-containing protein
MFSRLKIGTKILAVTTAIAVAVVATTGLVGDFATRDALEQEAFNRLTAGREMKAQQIEAYYELISLQIRSLARSRGTIEAMQRFRRGWSLLERDVSHSWLGESGLAKYYSETFLPAYNERSGTDLSALGLKLADLLPTGPVATRLQLTYVKDNPYPTGRKNELVDPGDGTVYGEAHRRYHPFFDDFLKKFGFYDIFLVDAHSGRIVYSVFKETDFGTSLLTGPYADTNFAAAFRAARGATDPDFFHLVDFEPYLPSYSAPASFISAPVLGDDGAVLGVLVFQMPIDRIDGIMTSQRAWADVGLGSTGQTYLVGEDFLLRNQSRLLIEAPEVFLESVAASGVAPDVVAKMRSQRTSIGLQRADTPGTRAALSGETGTASFEDFRGVRVLSAFRPLSLPGLNWAIMSEIDQAEALERFTALRDWMITIASLLLAVTVYASYYFALTLTRPLRLLTDTAKALTNGRLDEPVEVSSQDEIGALAEDFEHMRLALKRTFSDLEEEKKLLEERVEERTAQVNEALKGQEGQNALLESRNTELEVIQRELTESRQRTEASEQRIQAVLQGSPDAIISMDGKGNIGMFNKSAERMFGYEARSIIGKNIKMLMTKAVAVEHDYYLERYDPERPSPVVGQSREVLALRRDDTEFPIEVTVERVETGGEIFFVGILRDISRRVQLEEERRAAAEATEASQKLLSTILDNIPTPVFLRDLEGRFMLVNREYLRLHEIESTDEVVAKTLAEVLPSADLQDLNAADSAVVESGEIHLSEEFHTRSNGEQIIFSVTRFPVLDVQDKVMAVGGIDVDITESKRRQELTERQALEARLLNDITQAAARPGDFAETLQRCIETCGTCLRGTPTPTSNG